jgi:hypothetical protein
MSRLTARPALVALALSGTVLATGCGRSTPSPVPSDTSSRAAPALGSSEPAPAAAPAPGFPLTATKNTTRVLGADPVAIAANAARGVFPGLTAATRPQAVAIADRRDWRTALAASVLMSPPIRAPLLLSDAGQALPAASATALTALAPTGSKAAGGAQAIRVGSVPRPAGLKTTDIAGRDPFALAAAIDATVSAARGKTGDRVMIVSADDPAFAAPAAAYAAKSGDTILFARRGSLPSATRTALAQHQQPKIFVLGPPQVVGETVVKQLRRLGTVVRVGARTAAESAIAFARFTQTDFGWGVVDPGHGLVFQRAGTGTDPALPAAASALSASGSYGPVLLLGAAGAVDAPLTAFLRSIQPGYRTDPVRGVYNHGWVVGDADAISPVAQAQLDSLLEIMPENTASPAAP